MSPFVLFSVHFTHESMSSVESLKCSFISTTQSQYINMLLLCEGINQDLLERLQLPVPEQERSSYSLVLVERLIRVMSQAAQPGDERTTPFHLMSQYEPAFLTKNKCLVCVCLESKVRLATLELSCLLLKQSVFSGSHCIIKDVHLACLEVCPSVLLPHAFTGL